ncbi:hypothetical protein B0H10DRAFT_2431765, partial [Mycena sp. CBHHK59/15]
MPHGFAVSVRRRCAGCAADGRLHSNAAAQGEDTAAASSNCAHAARTRSCLRIGTGGCGALRCCRRRGSRPDNM